jgi:hypothetical protein
MTCPHGTADGAYVLGALSPAERAEFEQHLDNCAGCAAAVGQLAPLPGLLGRVDEVLLEPPPSDPARLPGLCRAVSVARRQRARRHRWRMAASTLAAALVAAGGVAWWNGIETAGEPPAVAWSPPVGDAPPTAQEMQPAVATSPVIAQVSVDESVGGSIVWMRCRYPDLGYELAPGEMPPSQTFRLVAVGTDGSVEQLGSWRAGPGQQVEFTGLTRFGDDLDRVELLAADGTTLLVHQR